MGITREFIMKTIRLFATVRDIVGSKRITVPFEDGDTVRVLVERLGADYPVLRDKLLDETGDLSSDVHIYVHGRNVEWLDGLNTSIRDSDDVFIVPPMAGG